jgi:hypothetical protein
MFHLHWDRANQEIAKIVDAGHQGAGLAFEGSFAPSHNALVRFNLHEDVGPVRFAGEGDSKDFQSCDRDAGMEPFESIMAGRWRSECATTEVSPSASAPAREGETRGACGKKSSTQHETSPTPLRSP